MYSNTISHTTHSDLQMTDDAVALFFPHAACGWGLQVLLSSNQQVPCCGVTAAMGTAVAVVRLLANGSSQDWKGETENDYMNRKQQCRVASFPNRAPIHKLVPANTVDIEIIFPWCETAGNSIVKFVALSEFTQLTYCNLTDECESAPHCTLSQKDLICHEEVN